MQNLTPAPQRWPAVERAAGVAPRESTHQPSCRRLPARSRAPRQGRAFVKRSGLRSSAETELHRGGRPLGSRTSVIQVRVLISHEELCLLVVRPSVGVDAPAGGRLCRPSESSRLWRQSPQLIASDDLADPRMIQADLLRDFAEGEADLLSFGESGTPGLPCSSAVALKLLLSLLHIAAGLPLIVGAHRQSLFADR